MDTIKKKTFTYKEKGKDYLLEVAYGIQNKGTDNAYFTVTGSLLERVNSKTGKNKYGEFYKMFDGDYYAEYAGGCIHDEIKRVTKEFDDIIPLHLSDMKGIPMHAFANGFYHLKNGFTDTPTDSEDFKRMFCEYYRIPESVFDKLSNVKNQGEYAILLIENGIHDKWEADAKAVIEKYEL